MRHYHFAALLMLLCTCTSQETQAPPSLSTIMRDTTINDTTFLSRQLYPSYQAVYIETDTSSEQFREILSPLNLNSEDFLTVYASSQDGSEVHTKKVSLRGLPVNWLPVYLHKNRYYLYFPPDRSTINKTSITDSVFVALSFDYTLIPLEDVKKHNATTYSIRTTPPEYNKSADRLIIHIIDPITRMAVWEYPDQHAKLRYSLYIPVENAHSLPLVVHQSKGEKPLHYLFDPVDFESLLENAKSIGP